MHDDSLPDRPIPPWMRPLRTVVRGVRNLKLRLKVPGRVTLGRDFSIGKQWTVLSPESFVAGDHVRVGQEFFVETNVEIGNDVLVSSRVSFVGDDHRFGDPGTSVFFQGRNAPATVRIEGDNVIGHGTIIVGDVTVGRGAIVGAGSVVTSDLPAWTVCAGVPARPLRPRPS